MSEIIRLQPRALLTRACGLALAAPMLALAQGAQAQGTPPPTGWQPGDQEEALRAPLREPLPEAPVVPAVRDRAAAPVTEVEVRGFRIRGVGEHPERGITPVKMQALLDARFAELAGGADRVTLDFDQLADAAQPVTMAYRDAGYVVSAAYLPAQTIGEDGIVEIAVLEGRLGRVIVEGNQRVRASAIAAPARRLAGRTLHRDEMDGALLSMRDIPGVTTSVVLQPGQATGETDLLVTATEEARPYSISIGASNHGTELTGRYRAQLGLAWRNALGIGDTISAGYARGYDPDQSDFAALAWNVPVIAVDGLSVTAAYSRSEMEVNRGPFAALRLTGPTSVAQIGADWRFVNRPTLQMQGGLRYVRERSRLEVLDGFSLSDQAFDVVDLGYTLRHIDRGTRGVNLVQANLRHAVDDRSAPGEDSVTPARTSDFTLLRVSLARMQYLTPSQRLFARVYGQYTDDVLVPMEQIALGGPDSIRALPVSDALGDRGYQATLEYQVDAPGFGDVASPFGGRPWRDLLQFEVFADHGRVTASPGSLSPAEGRTYNGAGLGLVFRLPHLHNLELRLAGAVPVGGRSEASDGDDFRAWARFGMTF
ncbi:ShlB/FhaC/HecB family hemolysin secretion/activation protein [Luteimonas sp. BDR2-5]|uniref:ShlB/FhaC/HecB family hemolysin secretion/activation protein n=1 Tax=Proluteimonas luteida TaxID=2878685 RepID=UPI001E58CC51|nr:ShlB/FhaC/HecB family hemolysin secretion/activation protein [Luteimonas sp. BDR2-5]MCD9027881.1 ShlB/FhaC/HecB family hemolysin secretion/activation protein [Luteimonas sp. BDR2-5]